MEEIGIVRGGARTKPRAVALDEFEAEEAVDLPVHQGFHGRIVGARSLLFVAQGFEALGRDHDGPIFVLDLVLIEDARGGVELGHRQAGRRRGHHVAAVEGCRSPGALFTDKHGGLEGRDQDVVDLPTGAGRRHLGVTPGRVGENAPDVGRVHELIEHIGPGAHHAPLVGNRRVRGGLEPAL